MPDPDTAATPHPCLIPVTPEARDAVGAETVTLDRLPFRIGRDLRDPQRSSFRFFRERRRSQDTGPNDLYLCEPGPRHRLSREHILIGGSNGELYVEDRRSACGTLVEGKRIGGKREGGRRTLSNGDTIMLGGSHSPFVFKFMGPGGHET